MKKYLFSIAIAILYHTGYTTELANLTQAKTEVIKFHDSGHYDYEVSNVIDQAKEKLTQAIALQSQKKTNQKLAIVLDIDDTSLSNYNELKSFDFANDEMVWMKIEANTQIPAIKQTLMLYQYAIKNKVAVFFITARLPQFYKTTEQALKNAGYTKFNQLYLLPKNYHQASFAPFKIKHRKKIEENGYKIIINIGDQYSDLQGGYAENVFKLPNYMY